MADPEEFQLNLAILLSALQEAGCDLASTNALQRSALHVAALGGAPSILIDTLCECLEVNARDLHGCAPLHLAKRAVIAHVLLEHGADLSIVDICGRTPMMHAAMRGDFELVNTYIHADCKVDVRDTHGDTALHLAATNDHALVVAALHDAGSELDSRNDLDWTPLVTAAWKGNLAATRMLLARGADVFPCIRLQHARALSFDVRRELLRHDVPWSMPMVPWRPSMFYAAARHDRRGIYTVLLVFQRLEPVAGVLNMKSPIHPCARALAMISRGWFRWDGDTDAGRWRRRYAALLTRHSWRSTSHGRSRFSS